MMIVTLNILRVQLRRPLWISHNNGPTLRYNAEWAGKGGAEMPVRSELKAI